jgi:hypothetical protein
VGRKFVIEEPTAEDMAAPDCSSAPSASEVIENPETDPDNVGEEVDNG